ncbi:hypothetical protein LZ24_02329 [Desulfobotulus alkaliphilus]|uniref:Uncharacterized protein n=1 Tax=Desulfobotulus alkaliphilus TaxID=622671 RepID=A0A562RMT0_9BACT|nr:hypothetical protein LZ24_02329 [Desulfobotulus alkaliphilus]
MGILRFCWFQVGVDYGYLFLLYLFYLIMFLNTSHFFPGVFQIPECEGDIVFPGLLHAVIDSRGLSA